ncbi:hypothetical protein JOF42_000358 [Microbacterium phyllosphaerae]|uniref:Metallo-beta-lactamase domain-containing protein n=1 Tax=Microbacterium phyllosphaerae TaxID=124798 RepID=A0ABS4WL54_9MICO|nr:MBL fold metallo-hydrolase [Microbacterium phyllosphaerae]MBP2376863.1 hypothetical protein [Microbacterium phyllosphaerae]
MSKRPRTYMRVLNVGDGACAVFTLPWEQSHFIVDCGATTRGKGVESARILSDALGESSRKVEAVLITHFDADHWAGILKFPTQWKAAPARPVTMRYPHLLPKRQGGKQQAAHLLLQAALVGASVTPITDIINAWRTAGATVHASPVKRGDSFTAAGEDWDVHWPPANTSVFVKVTRDNMHELADRIDGLAEKSPAFASAIDSVYEDWLTAERRSGLPDGTSSGSDVSAASVVRTLGLDEDELKTITRKLSAYANMLSVVHSTDFVINFGDCELTGLNALLRLQRKDSDLQSTYKVVFAPHHGTQIPRPSLQHAFPSARERLISQNGPQRLSKAQANVDVIAFKDMITLDKHINIHEHGHFYYPVR